MRHPSIRTPRVLAALLSAAIAAGAPGAVLRVDASLSAGANNGATWADAFQGRLGLQAALAVAQPGDEIWIANGQYAPAPPNGSRAVNFFLPANLTILGGFAGGESTAQERNPELHPAILTGDLNSDDGPPANGISPNIGDNSLHVVRINNGDGLTLDGLTIRAGVANLGALPIERCGANLFILGGAPVIRNCIIENGLSQWLGAGAVVLVASPTFIDCTFRENRADPGGSGAAVLDAAVATFDNCTFQSNFCGLGAGLYVGRLSISNHSGPTGEALVTRSRFVQNIGVISSPSGGGIHSRGGRLTVLDSAFFDNEVGGGGGACYINGGRAFIDRCDFVGNSAPGDGGGAIFIDGGEFDGAAFESTPVIANSRFVGNNGAIMCNAMGDAIVVNCTIANNTYGFGFFSWPTIFVATTSAITLSNSVVWGNNVAGVLGIDEPLAGVGPYTLQRCVIQGWVPADGGDAINADPLFRDVDGPDNTIGTPDDDVRPIFGSPAIDAGLDALVPAAAKLDIDARDRSIDADAQGGAVVDMGAYEHPCAPDITADGAVNFADLNALLGLFGQSADGPEDINADGFVGFADLNILLSAFGSNC